MRARRVLVTALLLAAAACAGPAPRDATPRPSIPGDDGSAPDTAARYTVHYRGRTIDLEPFLVGYPYSHLEPDLERGQLFYFEKTGRGTWLRWLPLAESGSVDLARGRRVTAIDWSQRSFWGGEFHAASRRLYFLGDENNDERMNLYWIDLAASDLENAPVHALTHQDYTYAWGFSEDQKQLAYVARRGEREPFDSCLHVLDLETGADREILCDRGGADRFTWSDIRFTPDASSVVLTVQHDGERKLTSLARIDLRSESPRLEFLTEPRVERRQLEQLEGWVGDDVFLYQCFEHGEMGIYRCDLTRGETRRIIAFDEPLRSAALFETSPPQVLAIAGFPDRSILRLHDAGSGELRSEVTVAPSVRVMDTHGGHGVVSVSSVRTPFQVGRIAVAKQGAGWRLALSELAGVPPELLAKISQVEPEIVRIPTFDRLPDGSRRTLHAFLLEPKDPPEDPVDRRIVITSFYGGDNSYRVETNIFAAAGIATLSPAPRGSWGFGPAFEALNDGDLGGDEIVDIIMAARWLVAERGYAPHQIGVYGGSHGGYATMRLLTFPPETNGRDASFDFGFGWSHAGFSDILTFYDSCNIPDWVVKEAGDPRVERAKLVDRSPIAHVDLLRAPLLLTHGSNDWRVPVEESRRFAARARELGKPVRLVEFPGQGHGIRGFANQVRYYQTVLSFIEGLGATP